MKIAIYKFGSYEHASEATDWKEADPTYVRLTEIVDVDLPRLSPEVTVPRELAALDQREKELTAKHLKDLAIIQSARKDLLSLAPPHIVLENSDALSMQ